MENRLYETIRKARRERGLTQEQLAEVMGVSVGAVSKWEQGQSIPEIGLLMELADFFQTSVEALLGFEIRNDSREEDLNRLKEYRHKKNFSHIWRDVEKILAKYPNCFDILYNSALLYNMGGLETKNQSLLQRALELFERSIQLISQNRDDTVSELSIRILMAQVLLSLEDIDKALEQLKRHNPCGINASLIGNTLASICP